MTDKIDLFTVDKDKLIEIVGSPSFIRPLNYYLMIALPTIEEKTKSGLFLPEETKETALVGNNIGRVIGKGGTVGGSTGAYADCADLQIGDYIGYNPHAGLPQDYEGYRVIILADEAMRITIPDPTKHTDGIFKTFKVTGIN